MDGKGADAAHARATPITTSALSPSGKYFVDTTRSPTCRRSTVLRDGDGKLAHGRSRRPTSRSSLATGWKPPIADHGEGARRQDRPLRPDVRARRTSIRRRSIRSSTTSIRARRPAASAAARSRRARRRAGARRARIRRRRDRRDGHALALEVVPRRVLRQHGRQHAPRSDRRHEGARRSATSGSTSIAPGSTATPAAASPPPTRCSAIPTSSRSASRSRATTTTASTRTTGASAIRACSRRKADGADNYDDQANQNLAKNLKGKLLLAHGTMDDNVPPYNTLLVVDALIKANKDFDLLMLPNQRARLRQRCRTT